MKALSNNSLEIDGFIISQSLHNQITATALFGIQKKDENHLGHDSIKWAINSDIICNGCNMCNSCQGSCHSSCQGGCTSNCQGSCHSSCQGGCTSNCQGCRNCNSGCTSSCNNGCYTGCTSRCVGCNSCNECQSCVGANCNSGNGVCMPSVTCLFTCENDIAEDCSGCFISCTGGCTSNCAQDTAQPASTEPIIDTPIARIVSVVAKCYGAQGGGYDQDPGSDSGYEGSDVLIFTTSEGKTIEVSVPGEKRNGKVKGSDRDAATLAWAMEGLKKQYPELNDADLSQMKIILTDYQGNVVSQGNYSDLSYLGSTSGFRPSSFGCSEVTTPTATYINPHTGGVRTHSSGCSSIL